MNLDFTKWVAFGSDGASVMTGKVTGVSKRIQDHVGQHVICIHCISHCVALAGKSAVGTSVLFTIVDKLMKAIATDFKQSAKKTDELKLIQDSFNDVKTLQILKFVEVRWISRFATMSRIISQLEPLLQFYSTQPGLIRFQQLAVKGVIRFMHFVADALKELQLLTKYSQSRSMTLDKLRKKYLKTVKNLKALYTQLGVGEERLIGCSAKEKAGLLKPGIGNTYTLYGHTLKNTVTDEDVESARIAFLDAVILDLENRFASLTTSTDAFRVFNDMQNDDYDDDLKLLADHYGISFDQLQLEWENMQDVIIFDNLDTIESITKYAQEHLSEYPLLSILLQTYIILPTTTSDVERGFSKMNRIKTDDRNRLGDVLIHCML